MVDSGKNKWQSGMGAIYIPTQAPDIKPFLLTPDNQQQKTTEVLLGYAGRHLDRTDIKSVVELHHAMRTGMNLEATILNRITDVERTLRRLSPAQQPSSEAVTSITEKRVGRVLAQQQFSDTRTLVVVIRPVPHSELRSIFSNQPNSIRRTIEDPPELRAHGWGIGTGSAARFIDGDFLQTESHRQVSKYTLHNLEFIVGARIYPDGLAWADITDSRFHPLALVEFVTNIFRFISPRP